MTELFNMDFEQSVLLTLMTVENSLETVMNDLTVDHFYAQRHKTIYKAVKSLSEQNKPYDGVFVLQQLQTSRMLDLAGGEEYLIKIMSECSGSIHNFQPYIAELNKLKNHREVLEIGKHIVEKAKDLTVSDIFLEAENLLDSSQSSTDLKNTSFDFSEAADKAIQRLMDKIEAKENKSFMGERFNLPQLDYRLGTIEKGHFCVIGGRPGSGKSTLAQMLAIQTAVQYKKAVLFVSAEMDTETLTNRMISALGQIPYNNLHNAEIYDGMFQQFTQTIERFRKLPIHIEEKQKPTIAEIQAYARKAKRKYGELGCIIVDYIGLVRDPSKKDRVQEVSSISRDLKAMGKEFGCPVIALAQLNRESEKNKRPVASDLKDSGQIEQDADQIILAHPMTDKEDGLNTGITELVIAKNRHGQRGVVNVIDRLDICRFVSQPQAETQA